MHLLRGIHLGYCTNIHRGETWAETWDGLRCHTLRVRDRVAGGRPYGIGLRLSAAAALELSAPDRLREFREWLDRERCYVFTINGFPYGRFHGTRVKEQVYVPDWTSPERLDYTRRLIDLLAELAPAGGEGSLSTVPCSFKEFIRTPDQERAMRRHLWECVEHLETKSLESGRDLHVGLEPEPLCYLETTQEAVEFLERMAADRPGDERLWRRLGVNYDACHLAIQYEEPEASLKRIETSGIRLSKVHFSAALRANPSPANRLALAPFVEGVYFHQVVAKLAGGGLRRYRDLDEALAVHHPDETEWRIHFHIPLHARPAQGFASTSDHLLGVMDYLGRSPERCRHVEMETYTWEVLPESMKNRDVVDQLCAEYDWTLSHLRERGLA
ncbi:MAG: hypothetical protein FJ404_03090 [Verrucomicrobia bacterium]|nr:hypothetical protein [Verrucomicrobiota bacterium]